MADIKEKGKKMFEKLKTGSNTAAEKIAELKQKEEEKNAIAKVTRAVVQTVDQDGNGVIDSNDLIIMALKIPGIRISRDEFLRKELHRHCTEDQIEEAIRLSPLKAGIDSTVIDKVADSVIQFERNAVSGISLALGIPGGIAMAATIPTDIAQFYGYMLRAAQKLMYLYGFPAIYTKSEGLNLDSETINSLTVCLGVMYGVASANIAIKAMAKALATGVEKQLLRRALTKGAIYPFVKQVAKWFGKKMTKAVFAGFFKKAIPIVGGIVGGGITYATFKPCCVRLKDTLKDTDLSNPNHIETEEEMQVFNNIQNGVIDVDPEDIIEVDETEEEISEETEE